MSNTLKSIYIRNQYSPFLCEVYGQDGILPSSVEGYLSCHRKEKRTLPTLMSLVESHRVVHVVDPTTYVCRTRVLWNFHRDFYDKSNIPPCVRNYK